MKFTLVVLEEANGDIDTAFGWIRRTSGMPSALRWRNGLAKLLRLLETDAGRFPEAHEAVGLGIDLREAIHGKKPHVHRVLFTIDHQTVYVHRVWHSAQNWVTEDDLLPPEA